jgi:hypothetical protein
MRQQQRVVVDRYTEAGEVGHVVDGAARGSELEIEQRNAMPSRKTTF